MFAVDQVASLVGAAGLGSSAPDIVLPLGISFFTFHGISYVVDVHRGTARPMRSVADYGQYMAFFPQLIAGPIVRYHEIDEQIREPPPRSQRLDDIAEGFPRFALGLTKKVVIADPLGAVADAAFDRGGAPELRRRAWLGALAFTVQIYFDFSGYSDMAIGLARMFGLRFPENFDRPVLGGLDDRLLAALAHDALALVPRLRLHPARRLARHARAQTVRNLLVRLPAHRRLARRGLDVRALGHSTTARCSWSSASAASPPWDDDALQVPRRAVTFLLVVLGLGHVPRRTASAQALDFYGAMVPRPGSTSSLPPFVAQALHAAGQDRARGRAGHRAAARVASCSAA